MRQGQPEKLCPWGGVWQTVTGVFQTPHPASELRLPVIRALTNELRGKVTSGSQVEPVAAGTLSSPLPQ